MNPYTYPGEWWDDVRDWLRQWYAAHPDDTRTEVDLLLSPDYQCMGGAMAVARIAPGSDCSYFALG